MPSTYQCKRKVCKNADNPSMATKMPNVHTIYESIQKISKKRMSKNESAVDYEPAQTEKIMYNAMEPTQLSLCNPLDKIILHNTSDNSTGRKCD